MFVYLITNIISGKRYVGQTIYTLEWRWKQHLKNKNCTALQGAIEKYGVENFIIEAICEPPTIELLNDMERYFIETYNSLAPNGYNLTTGGERPSPSQETRVRQAEAQLGKKQSEETKQKRRVAITGKKRSEETKQRMAEAQKGNRNRLGDTKSEEERKKISDSLQGNKNALGAVRSVEYRETMSEAQKERFLNNPVTEDTRRKMSESAKRRRRN